MTRRGAAPRFPVIVPDWPDVPARVQAFCTTRCGGVSSGPYGDLSGVAGFNLASHVGDTELAVSANRQLLNACLPSDVIFLSQVHGTIVVDGASLAEGVAADAVYTCQPGVVCAVLTADCLPVLFADEHGRVVAAAHAGWRGLAAGVLQNTVEKMRQGGAGRILAWMGPAIGADAFEVGADVLDAFAGRVADPGRYFAVRPGTAGQKYLADIYGLARAILMDAGVSQVSGGGHCTVREADTFYSYRRDGVTGRMASLVWIGQ